jgi:hypothetical protein
MVFVDAGIGVGMVLKVGRLKSGTVELGVDAEGGSTPYRHGGLGV